MKIALTLALGLSLSLAAASAPHQDKKEEKKAPPSLADMMPKPGPEMAKLKTMVGTWNVEETMEPGPMGPGGKGHGTSHVTAGPGGLSIVIDYHSTGGLMKGFKGLGVVAWEADAKAYKQVWADNMAPMIMVSTGSWDGDKLVMNYEGTMMGKALKGRDTMSGVGTDTVTLVSEMSMDGSPMAKAMTLVHKRAKAPEKKADAPKPEEKKN